MSETPTADHGQLFVRYRDKGDIAALEQLMDIYNKRIFNYLRQLLHSGDEAEDALQEVWLKVIRQKSSYKEQGQFSSWLYRIAHNHCTDLFRKKSCRTDKGEIVEDDEGFAYLDRVSTDTPSPYEYTLEEELLCQVEQEVAKMPELIREVYVLRAVQDLPFKEIAEIQNAPIGTVLSRMHQAVKRLQPLLRGQENSSSAEMV
ncbi:sigma-70 family RNA polymerase sigma factor [bacterium]|nr:sigma-70 family RNA polymerase sigma factor [bacterium]